MLRESKFLLLSIFVAFPSLSLGAHEPSWVDQPARSVDNGYIVYVSIGEDKNIERAIFKSEAAGLLDIANECTFAPKGARTEDHFQQSNDDGSYTVYTKTGLSFDDCEAAKGAVDPSQIRKLSNPQFAKDIQKYQDWLDSEVNQDDEETDEENNLNSTDDSSDLTSLSAGASVQTPEQFFTTRQRVYFTKETVILAPATSYSAGSPETIQYINILKPAVQQIRSYEKSHPGVRNWPHSWSRFAAQPQMEFPLKKKRPHPIKVKRKPNHVNHKKHRKYRLPKHRYHPRKSRSKRHKG